MGKKQAAPPSPDRSAMNAALTLLKYRARSEAELARRLTQKGISPPVVRKTVERLRELRLLDDEDAARQWAESARRAGRGEFRVRRDLRRRGIPRFVIDKVLAEEGAGGNAENDESARAWDLLLRRARKLPAALDRKARYRRLAGHLTSQGFSVDCVQEALERYFAGLKSDPDE